jgi:hypothetical protein
MRSVTFAFYRAWKLSACGVCFFGIAMLPDALAQGVPSTADFQNSLMTCAGGNTLTVDADLIGSIAKIYDGDRTQGKARIRNVGEFLNSLPEKDKLAGYQLYLKCIEQILPKTTSIKNATISIESWETGGWKIILTNPTQSPMSVTQAMLVSSNPVAGQPGFGFTLLVGMPPGEAQDGNIPGNKPTRAYLALFGPPQLCGNWRSIRELRFKQNSDFNRWNCKIELNLVSTSGERATISEGFECSRIPVPPPQC